MKTATSLWLAGWLIVGAATIPTAVSAEDYRRYSSSDYDRTNTWWERIAYGRSSRNLEGTWYMNGDRRVRTRIYRSRGGGLEGINRHGDRSRLVVDRNGDIRALDWGENLRGDVRRDRIEWSNGVIWTREPSRRMADRR
jgi:hypothetical protein